MTNFFAALLAVLFLAYVIARAVEAEQRDHNCRTLFRRWWRLGAFGTLFTFFVFTRLWAIGSSKEQEPFPGAERMLREEFMEQAEERYYSVSLGQQPRLSTNQFKAGFALTGATTNSAAAWMANPETAILHSRWALRGAADETFWLPATNWSFILGTNTVDGVHVSSSGTLSFGWPKGSPRAAMMPDSSGISFLAPLQGPLGIVPPGGRFWSAVSPSNAVFTWENVCAGRDTNSPVTFQAELFPNGDFVYRYAFTNALSLTNFAVGAQHNGGGETYALNDTNRLANGLELRWRAFGILDPDVDDHDGDGLSTYDEVMVYGTDPRLTDSDGDGLSDPAELEAGADPRDPDTDGDGLADGVDPHPLVWDDISAPVAADGPSYGYVVLHGLDPATNWTLDTDGDGWEDWKEILAGTGTNNPASTPQNSDGSVKIFDATFTLNADLPCNAVLGVGGFKMALRHAGSRTLTLREGVAYPVTLTAPQPCAASLSVTLFSAHAAFQNPGAAFTGGAQLPGGATVACGTIAQPVASIEPDRVCFHAAHPKTVSAHIEPPMAGAYYWSWTRAPLSPATNSSVNIPWDGADESHVWLEFTAAGASQQRTTDRGITRCTRVEEDTWCRDHGCEEWFCACDNVGAADTDFCQYHNRTVAECRAEVCPTHHCPYAQCPKTWCHLHNCLYSECETWWCHLHNRYLTECVHWPWITESSITASAAGPGDPVFGGSDKSAVAVNNDDDNANGSADSGESPVPGENDLAAVYPLGPYDGQCCPCPEHQRQGAESATLTLQSSKLALWADSGKTNQFGGTAHAGQAVYVEGLAPSASVGAEKLVWTWQTNSVTYHLTNQFTVLSVRLFGDLNLDGYLNAADQAIAPSLPADTGWCMPAASNAYRIVRLRTDVGLLGGAYTLSLSGGAGFRVWTTTPAVGEPLLTGGQTVTNGVGVTFLSGDDTDLFVEAVSNGTATLTYAFTGTNISCSASLKMTAWDIEFVHAEGDDEGQPMDELPIFTPCSGTGKGVPIYDSPESDLIVSFSSETNTNGARNAVLTYLGTQYGVTETASNSLIFANQDITALFSDTLFSDTNVAETVTATVTQPALGIADAVYACAETNALNNVFVNDPYGVVATLDGLSDSATNFIHIRITGVSCDKSFDLTESAPDSKCFSSTGLVVRIVGAPELTPAADTLLLSLGDGAGLSNTVFAVHETGGETLTFRNYAPPVSTDTADVPVPDFAPWRVKVCGIGNVSLVSSVVITTAVDSAQQVTFSATNGNLLSDQAFVLAPNRTFEAEIPAVYKPLRIDTSASKWWDANQKAISAEVRLYAMMSGCSKQKNMKEKPGALVIESLEWLSKTGRKIDTKGRFTEPLDRMGYAVYPDYSASATNLLANSIKGKQIWYSLSHGGLEYGTADSEFMGLLFLNGESIMASDLEPLNLDYRLVMVDGCCSAKTTSDNLPGAYNNKSLAATVEEFANSFGDKSAYVGWAWKMDAGNAQQLMAEFLQDLKYDKKEKKSRTVEEAYDLLLENNPDPSPDVKSEARLMKIYGNIDNIIDCTVVTK